MPGEALAQNHPLRKATWIWPEGILYLYNHYAHFRRDFDLKSPPKKAPLYITADKAYKLYVNGEYVCRGPARGYQAHWPFDEVDLSSLLVKGRNWISVEAYNPGISTFQYIHESQAGFLCAAKWGSFELVSDRSWLMRRSSGHLIDTARYSLQMDFQEHADARMLDRSWITSAESPTDWDARLLSGPLHADFPFGRPPWEGVEARGIPLMREEIVTPVGITSSAAGSCAEGYRTWTNVSWGWIGEATGIECWGDGSTLRHAVTDDWFEIYLEPTGGDNFVAVTMDMGRIIVGNLIVEAEGAAGGEVIDFQHCQTLRNGYPRFLPPGEGCLAAMANRLGLAEGRTSHEFFHPLGFRHVTAICRDLTQPITLRVKARAVGYPFSMKGEFDCSDVQLNAIHAACRATQQLCALDAYVDTPWREQAQWWGDARVQAKNTFYLDGDARLLARGVRSIAGQSMSQGLTYGHAPTMAHHCILPDFSLTWILTIWDHYWQTADISLFTEQFDRVMEVLAYFHTDDARSRSGLLRHDRRLWYFGDWADLYKGEVLTFMNLWYLYTIRKVAEMCRLAKRSGDASRFAKEASTLEALIMKKLFDTKAGMFRDGLDEKGKPAARHSVHEQTLALMNGLASKSHANMIDKRLLPYLRGEKMDCAVPSAFWCTFLLEEMGQRGYGVEVIEFIRRKWLPMLSTGTTWEGFEWEETIGASCSHAWSAHPSYHLVNIVAGIRQTAPGWKTIDICPHFVEGLECASARVPTPMGEIRADWMRGKKGIDVNIALPQGVAATVELPGIEKRIARKGKHSLRVEVDR